jgi:ABC-type Fe3+-hydroxamate transport system substrate-binding protein
MIIAQGELETFKFKTPFTKIISLVPSITWLLFDLDLSDKIAGVTKFCKAEKNIHSGHPVVGGTKNPDQNKIKSIQPDIIFANKEENRKEDIEALAIDHIVYLSDIKDLDSMYQMIHEIGILTGREQNGFELNSRITKKYLLFKNNFKNQIPSSVVYLIWKEPYMTIGSDTFIHYMLNLAGFRNCFADTTRYPVITMNELIHRKPDFVFLSSEPYPFNEKHFKEFEPLQSILVDGRMFSWYGSFILQSFDYLEALIQRLNSNL